MLPPLMSAVPIVPEVIATEPIVPPSILSPEIESLSSVSVAPEKSTVPLAVMPLSFNRTPSIVTPAAPVFSEMVSVAND